MLDELLEGDEEQQKKDEDLLQEWKEKAELLRDQGLTDKSAAEAILSNPNATPAAKRIAADNKAEAERDIAFADNLSNAVQAAEKAKTQLQQDLIKEAERRAEIDMTEAQRELDRATREGNTAKQQAARDKLARATADLDDAKGLQNILDQRTRNRKSGKFGGGEFVQLSFGEAEGSLLGVEGAISAGLGIDGIANIDKEFGTLAVTLPDIQLTDIQPDTTGELSATSDDFEDGSLQDDKRQLVKLSVDAGALLGAWVAMPAGRTSVSVGPLSLNVTTVAFDVIPRLSVNQDVEVVPYVKSAAFDFLTPVKVKVNGGEFSENVQTVFFVPGDTIEIDSGGTPVQVTPRLHLGNRFTNDIGLDVDLQGYFEAFSIGISLFNQNLLNLGPLLTHQMKFGEFDLGSVFDRTFDLETVEQTLEPFIVGGSQQSNGGAQRGRRLRETARKAKAALHRIRW